MPTAGPPRPPSGAWVDVEAARDALDQAEGHLHARRTKATWGLANVAASVAARPLLAGLDGEWIARASPLVAMGNDCLELEGHDAPTYRR